MTDLDPTSLCQIEIPVSDARKAAEFYERAFGWRTVPAEMHEYVILEVPEGCPFGIALVPRRGDQAAPGEAGPVLYFGVSDPERLVARVEDAGGAKRFGPVKLFGYGLIWQVSDPDGNRFGFYCGKPG